MDLRALLGQFIGPDGSINLPEEFNLAFFAESIFLNEMMAGAPDKKQLIYHTYAGENEHSERVYTRHEFNTRVKTVATRLQSICEPGQRVAIMCGNSPEYIYSFLGAVYANTIPVPLYDPKEPGHAAHLAAVLETSEPVAILTNKDCASTVRTYFSDRPAAERPRIIAVDALPDIDPDTYSLPDYTTGPEAKGGTVAPVDQLAFLQFTSGSTRKPAGVEITNRQILANALQIFHHAQLRIPARAVIWLPLHHDMGLILATFFMVLGEELDLLTPRDFVQHPKRWIELLDRREGDGHEDGQNSVYSVGPNFSLGLAARYANPTTTESLTDLDLSAVEGLISGAEPVTETVVREFLQVFEPYKFTRTALRPSYGMAEAALLVSTPVSPERPKVHWVDREKLGKGTIELVEVKDPENPPSSATTIIAVGSPALQAATIVDPETGKELEDGVVGELWIHGSNVARGYLNQPEETQKTFGNYLKAENKLENSRAKNIADDARWLASGDLAIIYEGEIYITGRLKDLVVVGGRNHYPQDIELTAQNSTTHVRPESIAAFAIDGDDVEQLVIIAERNIGQSPDGDYDAINTIRGAVTTAHGVTPSDIKIVEIDAIPRSSSAKIARRVCKAAYERGEFN